MCIIHTCRKCDDMWMDNILKIKCKCGSEDVQDLFDEETIQAVELEDEDE